MGNEVTDHDIQWDDVDCPLCDGVTRTTELTAADSSGLGGETLFSVVRCTSCGLRYTNPRPGPNSIGQFYGDDYSPHQHCGLTPSQTRRARFWSQMPRFTRLRSPERRGLPLHGKGRLLDVGCGGGGFLQRASLQGWDVTGLDISSNVVQRIQTELGLHAIEGTLPHPELAAESFDYITMWQCLEHVHQPRPMLEEVRRLLIPGGRFLVAVPNFDSGPFRWFGKGWIGLDLPRHLTHFTPITLQKMLDSAGLDVQSIRTVGHSGWLRGSAELSERLEGSHWRNRLLRKKRASQATAYWLDWTGGSDYLIVLGFVSKRHW